MLRFACQVRSFVSKHKSFLFLLCCLIILSTSSCTTLKPEQNIENGQLSKPEGFSGAGASTVKQEYNKEFNNKVNFNVQDKVVEANTGVKSSETIEPKETVAEDVEKSDSNIVDEEGNTENITEAVDVQKPLKIEHAEEAKDSKETPLLTSGNLPAQSQTNIEIKNDTENQSESVEAETESVNNKVFNKQGSSKVVDNGYRLPSNIKVDENRRYKMLTEFLVLSAKNSMASTKTIDRVKPLTLPEGISQDEITMIQETIEYQRSIDNAIDGLIETEKNNQYYKIQQENELLSLEVEKIIDKERNIDNLSQKIDQLMIGKINE